MWSDKSQNKSWNQSAGVHGGEEEQQVQDSFLDDFVGSTSGARAATEGHAPPDHGAGGGTFQDDWQYGGRSKQAANLSTEGSYDQWSPHRDESSFDDTFTSTQGHSKPRAPPADGQFSQESLENARASREAILLNTKKQLDEIGPFVVCSAITTVGAIRGFFLGCFWGASFGLLQCGLRRIRGRPALDLVTANARRAAFGFGGFLAVEAGVACSSGSMRKKWDTWNHLIGGGAAGAVLGLRTRNPNLIIGFAGISAAVCGLVDAMSRRVIPRPPEQLQGTIVDM